MGIAGVKISSHHSGITRLIENSAGQPSVIGSQETVAPLGLPVWFTRLSGEELLAPLALFPVVLGYNAGHFRCRHICVATGKVDSDRCRPRRCTHPRGDHKEEAGGAEQQRNSAAPNWAQNRGLIMC